MCTNTLSKQLCFRYTDLHFFPDSDYEFLLNYLQLYNIRLMLRNINMWFSWIKISVKTGNGKSKCQERSRIEDAGKSVNRRKNQS